jgi:hypothetical protein
MFMIKMLPMSTLSAKLLCSCGMLGFRVLHEFLVCSVTVSCQVLHHSLAKYWTRFNQPRWGKWLRITKNFEVLPPPKEYLSDSTFSKATICCDMHKNQRDGAQTSDTHRHGFVGKLPCLTWSFDRPQLAYDLSFTTLSVVSVGKLHSNMDLAGASGEALLPSERISSTIPWCGVLLHPGSMTVQVQCSAASAQNSLKINDQAGFRVCMVVAKFCSVHVAFFNQLRELLLMHYHSP